MATTTHSAEETIEFARDFARKLKGGEVVGLLGDLGSGKTTFVKGLVEELGVEEPITSPTFVILKEYILRLKLHLRGVGKRLKFNKLIHIDAYRVESLEDIKSVGIEDYFTRSGKQGSAQAGSYLGRDDVVMIVEWAEKIKDILPKNTIYIEFKHKGENEREIKISNFTVDFD